MVYDLLPDFKVPRLLKLFIRNLSIRAQADEPKTPIAEFLPQELFGPIEKHGHRKSIFNGNRLPSGRGQRPRSCRPRWKRLRTGGDAGRFAIADIEILSRVQEIAKHPQMCGSETNWAVSCGMPSGNRSSRTSTLKVKSCRHSFPAAGRQLRVIQAKNSRQARRAAK